MPQPFPNDGSMCGGYGMHHTQKGLRDAVLRSMSALNPITADFDALYVTGNSGVVVGSIVAFLLHKELIILRKAGQDGSHLSHGQLVEGACGLSHARFIILDDFCSSGATLRNLMRHQLYGTKLVGVCLYGHPRASAEIEAGYAKEFYDYARVPGKSQKWRLVRRSEDSLLFDLTHAPIGVEVRRMAFDGTPMSMPAA